MKRRYEHNTPRPGGRRIFAMIFNWFVHNLGSVLAATWVKFWRVQVRLFGARRQIGAFPSGRGRRLQRQHLFIYLYIYLYLYLYLLTTFLRDEEQKWKTTIIRNPKIHEINLYLKTKKREKKKKKKTKWGEVNLRRRRCSLLFMHAHTYLHTTYYLY